MVVMLYSATQFSAMDSHAKHMLPPLNAWGKLPLSLSSLAELSRGSQLLTMTRS